MGFGPKFSLKMSSIPNEVFGFLKLRSKLVDKKCSKSRTYSSVSDELEFVPMLVFIFEPNQNELWVIHLPRRTRGANQNVAIDFILPH